MDADRARVVAIEWRMRGPTYRAVSLALGRSILAQDPDPLDEAMTPTAASAEELLFAIRCHGVAGHLAALPRPGCALARVAEAVAAEAERIAQRSARLTDDLRAIAAAAARAGLACAPLKGTALRVTRDAHPELRPSADVDLLIDPAELDAWAVALASLGYAVTKHLARHVTFERPGRREVDAAGDHPDHPRPVELHPLLFEWVFGRKRVITAAYRAGLRDAFWQGVALRVPDDAALSLHLALHAAPLLLGRGLRLVQLLDLRWLGDDDATIARLREELGPVAWAVVQLAERDLPGLVPARLRTAFDDVAPAAWRRWLVPLRPGLADGDPLWWRSLAAERALEGPSFAVRRMRWAVEWFVRRRLAARG